MTRYRATPSAGRPDLAAALTLARDVTVQPWP